MGNTEPILETFYNHETSETITRQLTPKEIAELPQATDETPSPDDVDVVETPDD
jgi:hypothetical protein